MPPQRRFNDYRIEGDHAVLIITDKNGVVISDGEVRVSVEDLPVLKAHGTRWHLGACGTESCARRYVRTRAPVTGPDGKNRNTIVYLHRFLTSAGKGRVVDHINGDSLDNRRSNLRVVTQQENLRNRRGATRRNALGLRNVRHEPGCTKRPFRVELRDRGNVAFTCRTTTRHIAAITAELARVYLWGTHAA